MPTVTIFKESFVHSLRGSVRANLKKYGDDDSWTSDVGVKSQREIETTLELKEPFELLEPVNGDLKDIENAIRVHKALPHLTPLQARDPRLWTALHFAGARGVARNRWQQAGPTATPGDWHPANLAGHARGIRRQAQPASATAGDRQTTAQFFLPRSG
jgi:hypothetical protein